MNTHTLKSLAILPHAYRQTNRAILYRNVALPTQWRHRSQPLPSCQARDFNSSLLLLKKGGKAARKEVQSQGRPLEADDPYDFSLLTNGIENSMNRLTSELDKLRPGGRFNPEVLEAVQVTLGKSSGGHKQRLGNLAQVVAKGRALTLLVEDKDHIKSIKSAVLGSNLNLTPQPAPDNPNNILINLPPTTKESRDQAVQTAQKAADIAKEAIRNARQAQHKKLRQMQQNRTARPDDVKKAGDKMEKVVADATAKVNAEIERKKKVLLTV
ncbi:MAG: hypothetical protein M1820_010096 [Bogoriella megaspora]|nr:MAG: hypothetical protein M1820_010096 [Bogoriella megaspora]